VLQCPITGDTTGLVEALIRRPGKRIFESAFDPKNLENYFFRNGLLKHSGQSNDADMLGLCLHVELCDAHLGSSMP